MFGLKEKKPIVALIGRTNVGKSTLFNRLLRKRIAVVDPTPGVTRDPHFAELTWNGKTFILVDTGGFITNPESEIEEGITNQAKAAIEGADLVLLVLEPDITPNDKEIAILLKKYNKNTVVIINKVDDKRDNWSGAEAEGFRLGNVHRVSAKFGYGIGDLLDEIVNKLPKEKVAEKIDEEIASIAIVGKPNVGKSTLVNKLVGKQVALTHRESGTTIDPVDSFFEYDNKTYRIVDTAGIFKKCTDVYYYASLRTLSAIENSDIAVLVIDATQGITRQDKRIASMIIERYRGMIIAVNKWDLMPKLPRLKRDYEQRIRTESQFLSFAPIVFISALKGSGLGKLKQTISKVVQRRHSRVKTSELNKLVENLQKMYPPPMYKGRRPKIFYAVQSKVRPPEFVFFSKLPEAISPSYQRYLANKIREEFDYEGVPFKVIFRDKRR